MTNQYYVELKLNVKDINQKINRIQNALDELRLAISDFGLGGVPGLELEVNLKDKQSEAGTSERQ